MMDLSGPKIRTGKLRGGEALLEEGAQVRITSENIVGDRERFSANYPFLAREVRAGDRILISDGEIELQVLDTTDKEVIALTVHGGLLAERKGINLPGAQISIPSTTEKDIADLRFGLKRGIDIVAQSFVRRASDCLHTRDLIREFGDNEPDRAVRLIAKIEKPEAVDDLSNILDAADGVMVARGDLAVETAPERVPVLQKKIIAESLNSEKTVITATQMLQSMVESPWPTRAEASDVSNAILDGSDAVMLSEETAVGHFPIESVLMMDRIICSTEESSLPKNDALRQSLFSRRHGSYGRAIAEAAAYAAEEIDCRLIVVLSGVGYMARHISALRPRQRIIAFTPFKHTYNQLAITWGVEAHLVEEVSPGKDMLLARADRFLLEHALAERGEGVVVMTGKLDDPIRSYSMKLHCVGDLAEEA